MPANRQILLDNRPQGEATVDNFKLVTTDTPALADGQVLVKHHYLSLDPYMRGRMNDVKSYTPPFALGEAMQGGAVGEVIASNDPSLKVGDLVQSMFGWREAFNAPAGAVQKLDTFGLPPQAFLGVAGMPGMTAWAGLLKVAAMKEGDIVFVSGAAGAVGQVVVQIAKIKGNTVIGSCGGPEKVAFLKSIGCDEVIDYKAEKDLTAALNRVAPKGIDVYFENVGGEHMDAALAAARPFARFALCGMISQYNSTGEMYGVKNLILAVGKSIRLEGFIVSNHFHHLPEFLKDMSGWIAGGKIQWKETVDEGIENAPGAFLKLFRGENTGKMLVKLG